MATRAGGARQRTRPHLFRRHRGRRPEHPPRLRVKARARACARDRCAPQRYSGGLKLARKRRKSEACRQPKRRPRLRSGASQDPTAQTETWVRNASFRLLVTPNPQRDQFRPTGSPPSSPRSSTGQAPLKPVDLVVAEGAECRLALRLRQLAVVLQAEPDEEAHAGVQKPRATRYKNSTAPSEVRQGRAVSSKSRASSTWRPRHSLSGSRRDVRARRDAQAA